MKNDINKLLCIITRASKWSGLCGFKFTSLSLVAVNRTLHDCLCSVAVSPSFYSICGYGYSHQMKVGQQVHLEEQYIPNSNHYTLVF